MVCESKDRTNDTTYSYKHTVMEQMRHGCQFYIQKNTGDYWSLYADIVLLPVLLNNNNDWRTLYRNTIFAEHHKVMIANLSRPVHLYSATHTS